MFELLPLDAELEQVSNELEKDQNDSPAISNVQNPEKESE